MSKIQTKYDTLQELLGVEEISGKILWTSRKKLFAFIRVRGKDNSLLGDRENTSVTEQITLAISEEKEPFQIISVPRTVDTQTMLQQRGELKTQTTNEARLLLLDGEISALEEMSRSGAKEPLLFLKIWKDAEINADQALLQRAADLVERLNGSHITAEIMEDQQILHLCSIYAELGIWQDADAASAASDVPYLKDRLRKLTRKDPSKQAYADMLEQIIPVGGISVQPTKLIVGSAYCRCYGVTRYPAELDYGWAVRLTNATDAITCITYYPGSAGEIGDALSRSIRASNRDAIEESDARRKKRFERKASDADRLIDNLDARGMALGHISIVVMPYGSSPEELEIICKDVVARFSAKKMKLKALSHLQRDAFLHLSPYYPTMTAVDEVVKRIIPLETVLGGYPCTITTLRDDHGIYFARTADRGMLSLDILYRGSDRTNGNGIVTGIPGMGKSTALKHLLQSMFMQGVRCIVIDPEREFRDLCKSLGGSWWDAGGGNAKNNLLQIQVPVLDSEDEKMYQSANSPLAQHLQHIQTILRYKIPSLTDANISLLLRCLRQLYEDFGITLSWEFDPERPATQYPIMEDLYGKLVELSKTDARYEELELLLEDMAIGADSIIWNGHTNIDFRSPLVVIDTNQLWNSTQRNRAAQYYNLMRLAFSVASADRDTPYLIIADEAQTVFDPELPQAAAGLHNIALRGRKYEVNLWLAFHSLHELLDDRVRIYGQPILDAAAYKILFGTDGRNLADTVSLFHLTPAEETLLEARQRKKALALIGAQHLKVEFDIPAYKLRLMGSGGGR